MNETGFVRLSFICLLIIASQTATIAGEIRMTIPDTSASANEFIDIPIRVSDAAGISGAEIKVTFDAGILEAQGTRTTALTSGFMLADTISRGKIVVGLARDTSTVSGTGDFVIISFRVDRAASPGDSTALTFEYVALYDEAIQLIPAETHNGWFKVADGIPPPEAIAVSPNPFTPNNDGFNDQVSFRFPDETSGAKDVLIYTLGGRQVRSLEAGNARIVKWDGRDHAGRELEPGNYIYLMRENGANFKNGTVTLMR